ncbi:MAG: diaminopimelate decarboxylase, partial [Ilumatobacter sp.]
MSTLDRRLLSDNTAVDDDGMLTVGGCRIDDVAAEYGTPVFVYDEQHLRDRCREAVAAFGRDRVIYATKAFLCRAMAKLAYDEGMLLDVASGGELHVAMSAGVPASACTLHGNNKSIAELRMAISAGVKHVIVDSFDEM